MGVPKGPKGDDEVQRVWARFRGRLRGLEGGGEVKSNLPLRKFRTRSAQKFRIRSRGRRRLAAGGEGSSSSDPRKRLVLRERESRELQRAAVREGTSRSGAVRGGLVLEVREARGEVFFVRKR